MMVMMMMPARSLAQIVHLLVGFSAAVWAGDIQNYLTKFEGSDQQWYPTSFTRDIVPVGFSHGIRCAQRANGRC